MEAVRSKRVTRALIAQRRPRTGDTAPPLSALSYVRASPSLWPLERLASISQVESPRGVCDGCREPRTPCGAATSLLYLYLSQQHFYGLL